jgi:hypothetical protein
MHRTASVFLAAAFVVPSIAFAAFSDVPSGQWYTSVIEQAAKQGFVSGYTDAQGQLTGRFGPTNPVTRAEAMKMALTAADIEILPSAIEGEHWFGPYERSAERNGIRFPAGYLRYLDKAATRAEVAQIFTSVYAGGYHFGDTMGCLYTDVPYDHALFTAISDITKLDVMVGDGRDSAVDVEWGDPDTDILAPCVPTTFRPDAQINRAEAAKVAVTARQRVGTRASAMKRLQGTSYESWRVEGGVR